MDAAPNIIAQTIGVLVTLWVLGYTGTRVHEAYTKLSGSGGEAADVDGSSPASGGLGDLWKQMRDAAAAGVGKLKGRKAPEADNTPGGTVPGPTGEDTQGANRRDTDGFGPGAQQRPDWQTRPFSPDAPEGVDVEVIGTRPNTPPTPALDRPIRALTRPAPDSPDLSVTVEPDRPGPDAPLLRPGITGGPIPFGPLTAGRGVTDRPDITVEQQEPQAPAVARPEITAPGRVWPELDAPVLDSTGAKPPTTEATPEPYAATVAVEVIRQADQEGTDMAGKFVAIPGSSGVAVTAGSGLVRGGGGGDSHESAKDYANKIRKAFKMTADSSERSGAMAAACVDESWNNVSRLEASGIGGKVSEAWCSAVEAANRARLAMAEAHKLMNLAVDAADEAYRLQARTGDNVQTAVAAAGKSVANNTRYYGKR